MRHEFCADTKYLSFFGGVHFGTGEMEDVGLKGFPTIQPQV
jgi:hypothetical protein